MNNTLKLRKANIAEMHQLYDEALFKSLKVLKKAQKVFDRIEQGPFGMIFPTLEHRYNFEAATEFLWTYIQFYEDKIEAAGYEKVDGKWIKPKKQAKSPVPAKPEPTPQQPEQPMMIVSQTPGKKNGAATKKQAEKILPIHPPEQTAS